MSNNQEEQSQGEISLETTLIPDTDTDQVAERTALSKIRTEQVAPALEREQIVVRKHLRTQAKIARKELVDQKSASWRAHKELSAQLKIAHKEIGTQLKRAIAEMDGTLATVYDNSVTAEVNGGRAALAIANEDRRAA